MYITNDVYIICDFYDLIIIILCRKTVFFNAVYFNDVLKRNT